MPKQFLDYIFNSTTIFNICIVFYKVRTLCKDCNIDDKTTKQALRRCSLVTDAIEPKKR